jgi:hypothetical protein
LNFHIGPAREIAPAFFMFPLIAWKGGAERAENKLVKIHKK